MHVLPSVLRASQNLPRYNKLGCSGNRAVAPLGIAWHISGLCTTQLSHSLAHSELLRSPFIHRTHLPGKEAAFLIRYSSSTHGTPFKFTSSYAVVVLDVAVGYQKAHAVTCRDMEGAVQYAIFECILRQGCSYCSSQTSEQKPQISCVTTPDGPVPRCQQMSLNTP